MSLPATNCTPTTHLHPGTRHMRTNYTSIKRYWMFDYSWVTRWGRRCMTWTFEKT
jgi:hypothetical protein